MHKRLLREGSTVELHLLHSYIMLCGAHASLVLAGRHQSRIAHTMSTNLISRHFALCLTFVATSSSSIALHPQQSNYCQANLTATRNSNHIPVVSVVHHFHFHSLSVSASVTLALTGPIRHSRC